MAMNSFEPNDRQKRLIIEANKRAEKTALEGRHAPNALVARMSQETEITSAAPHLPLGKTLGLRPTLFLDIDDVLALNKRYGGRDVQRAMASPEQAPDDLYREVFSPAAVEALNEILHEFNPCVVLTTSWLKLLDREHFIDLFSKTGVSISDSTFHQNWDAPQNYGTARADAIDSWLKKNHRREPIVVLDDDSSGEGLVDGMLHQFGRVVLCEVNVGFNSTLLPAARRALLKPFDFERPWER